MSGVCEICGAALPSHRGRGRGRTRYCSDYCASEALRRQARDRDRAKRARARTNYIPHDPTVGYNEEAHRRRREWEMRLDAARGKDWSLCIDPSLI